MGRIRAATFPHLTREQLEAVQAAGLTAEQVRDMFPAPIASAVSTSIRAVPCYYRGTKFASTLEADWAATLDALSIAWQYEPEAVELPSGEWYRPDFYLPDCATWLEVKGAHDERLHKAMELGEAVAHPPECDGVWRGEPNRLKLQVQNTATERKLAEIIAAAPDGTTSVMVKVDRRPPHAGQPRTLRIDRIRRRIAIDRNTASALEPMFRISRKFRCCDASTDPWRLVVIGRAAVEGATTWESAQKLIVALINCNRCGKFSFMSESDMTPKCRRCGAVGNIASGLWGSGPHGGYKALRFIRAPRRGAE